MIAVLKCIYSLSGLQRSLDAWLLPSTDLNSIKWAGPDPKNCHFLELSRKKSLMLKWQLLLLRFSISPKVA